MVTPLETRVALNALPNQGPVAFQEQAGMVYRQLQELKEAGIQAKTRDSRIDELREKENSVFKKIENPGDESPRKQELFDRQRDKHKPNDEEPAGIYFPQTPLNQNRKTSAQKVGQFLDLTG